MKIKINGEDVEIGADSITVTELLVDQSVKMPDMVTVEYNGDIIDRDVFETTTISEGDVIEFLYFMGGGSSKWGFETAAIHAGSSSDPVTGATNTPIYQSAGFSHDTAQDLEDIFNGRQPGFFYSRSANPTVAALEERITHLETGLGTVCVSSGMAAITLVILSLCRSGDNFIASKSLFGSTFYLFKGLIENLGITVKWVPATDLAAYQQAIDDRTQFVFIEAIGNPQLDVVDIRALSDITNQHQIPLVVDSTFTTPYLLKAKALGVSLVTHATTKYLCGGGLAVGGALVDTGVFNWKDSRSDDVQSLIPKFGRLAGLARFRKVRSNTGNCMSANNAFLTIKAIETLALRMERHCANAQTIATFLSSHSVVDYVNYPGLSTNPTHIIARDQFDGKFGGMLTIRLGSKARAHSFLNSITLIRNLVNLGDSKTLAVHPRHTIYRDFSDEEAHDAGVYDDLVRVSIGLEDATDLMVDFDQALGTVS